MIVCVEGAPGSGRTTLAWELAARLGWMYAPRSAAAWTPTEVVRTLWRTSQPTVLDVGLLADLGTWDRLERVTLERVLRLRGGLVVHVSPAWLDLLGRAAASGRSQVGLREAWDACRDAARRLQVPVLPYVAGHVNELFEVLETVTRIVRDQRGVVAAARRDGTGAGTVVGPKLVLVGESTNLRSTWLGIPFDRGAAAAYLDTVLQEARIPERHVYVTNADLLMGSELEFLLKGGPCEFAALGREAATRLRELHVPFAELEHPAFRRRFKWHEVGEYVEQFQALYARLRERM